MFEGNSELQKIFYPRPTWDEFWFVLCIFYSTRGTCNRLRAACLIVDRNNRLVGAGYNGSLAGDEHCDEVGHFMVEGHCLRTLHAEENALLYNTKENLEGCTAYLSGTPCIPCIKKLLSKEVRRILYAKEYENNPGEEDKGQEFIHRIAYKKGADIRYVPMDFPRSLEKMFAIMNGPGGVFSNKTPSLFMQKKSPSQDEKNEVLRIERIGPSAKLPTRAHEDDAGLDVYAAEDVMLEPGKQLTIGTGVRLAIPKGHAGFVWDKSGLAANHRLKTLAGVIDSNYRGELKVVLANMGNESYQISQGEKIAQLVIQPVSSMNVEEESVDENTERGEKGFGSSGIT